MSTDYSKLSDFEIDKAVADTLGIDYEIAIMFVSPADKINGNHVEEYVMKKITSNEKHWRRFSPTRRPEDAWQIIIDNKISIVSLDNKWLAAPVDAVIDGITGDSDVCFYASCDAVSDANPLRAAMIVFLMMQDGE